jgi:hypothetical protein
MNKHIPAIFPFDEAESLLVTKPLYDSFCHSDYLLSFAFVQLVRHYFGKAKRTLPLRRKIHLKRSQNKNLISVLDPFLPTMRTDKKAVLGRIAHNLKPICRHVKGKRI